MFSIAGLMRICAGAGAQSGLYKGKGWSWAMQRIEMLRKNLAVSVLCAACLTVVIACSPAGDGVQSVSAQTPLIADETQRAQEPLSRATRLAEALAGAETAHGEGRTDRLMQLVSTLKASGLSPHDQQTDDIVDKWSQAVGMDPTPFRGRLLGPAYVRGELAPGETWKSAQTFKSGEPSTLAVSHRGAGPVRITVSDQRARTVCRPGSKPSPECRFTPMYTQRYDIELFNEGTGRAVYFLVFD